MIGMLAARVYHRWGSRAALFPFAAGLVLALHQFERGQGSVLAPGGPAWTMVIDVCQALVWAFAVVSYIPLAVRLPKAFSRQLSLLGTVSYSLYLLHYGLIVAFNNHHWQIDVVANKHVNALIIFGVIQLPLLLLACALTYNVIEKPFLQMRVRYLHARGEALR
jgi:peptidoglycan/LPS O-acetylase OafA/YrhL